MAESRNIRTLRVDLARVQAMLKELEKKITGQYHSTQLAGIRAVYEKKLEDEILLSVLIAEIENGN